MSEVVSDASPLIVLAKAQLLDLTPKLFERVLVPEEVMIEIQGGPSEDPLRRAVSNCDWMLTVRLDSPLPADLVPRLGTGEAAVLEYARTHGNLPVLVDDRQARRRAESLGLKVYGTLSLIAMATTHGHIQSFSAAVQQLRGAGLYVSDDVIDAVSRTVK
jgi:predicted nucleic acid-binding protein